jgi:hypothetical protein
MFLFAQDDGLGKGGQSIIEFCAAFVRGQSEYSLGAHRGLGVTGYQLQEF